MPPASFLVPALPIRFGTKAPKNLPQGDSDFWGRRSEDKVGSLLVQLQNKSMVDTFTRSEPNDATDKEGVDFWVAVKTDKWYLVYVPLQVKSSHKGIVEYRKKHPEIPVVNALQVKRQKLCELLLRYVHGGPVPDSK